jgi:hypothetical protein|tara:strand:- start:951 stop:2018 length:1068 start_codon:yes stop_codon:yes gene_type:complete
MAALNSNLAPGVLTTLNTGAADGGVGERVLIDYKDAIQDYKVVDLPALSMFCDPMTTDTGGDIDITFAKPSMGMEEINEGNTPKYQHTNLRSERVSVDEWGLAVGVTRRMIEDSRFNEVEMALNEARRAVDRHVTKNVVYGLLGVGDSTLKTGVSGGTSITASTTETVITTFADAQYGGFLGSGGTVNSGRIYSYGNTSDAVLTGSHYVEDTGAAGSVTLSKITDSMEFIGGHGYNPTALLISPGHYKTILNMADFTTAVANSGRYVLDTPVERTSITGLIGSIYGLRVYVNAWCPPDRYFVWDESVKPMAYVERRPLTVEEANPGFGIVGSYMSMRYGLKVVNPASGVVIYNSG